MSCGPFSGTRDPGNVSLVSAAVLLRFQLWLRPVTAETLAGLHNTEESLEAQPSKESSS